MNLKRLEQCIRTLNQFGYSDNTINRLAYSPAERQAVRGLAEMCLQAGMSVRMDAAGNLIATRKGTDPSLPAVACGSHLDSVIDAGQYDGVIGVAAGLEAIRSLNDQEIITRHPIELICFTCEESSRFGVSTIGSKAMAGVLDREAVGALVDRDGTSFRDALSECFLHFDKMDHAARSSRELKLFLELHIEQGPVLEQEDKPIGIVTGIAGPTRLHVRVQGKASHTGTTPMDRRQDAFLGAAEIGLALEQAALEEKQYGTVGTVGVCNITPGAMNVVPDAAELKIDIRGIHVSSKQAVLQKLLSAFERVEQTRGLRVEWRLLSDEEPVLLDPSVIGALEESCRSLGLPYLTMPSGAGHDAMNMARLCPTGMIFVPSKDGLSHHRDEYTPIDQIGMGATLLETMLKQAAIVEASQASAKPDQVGESV
ncbi:Zn-dependent hydrolase [Brevibacillus ruminantium]|uniref:Zn-dependent hydrolase n=1 Tax=Brevibacillus ruminantium TaxID=2950604 RepID=A0ABY4WKG9_9BACL|nr:Zn-dependent hydrolase [Brevibacillus ruminantium]USG67617.1 Zn-dependent hydrolase [Brevibacillus ruminantium]